jgi:hypothetical protein
MILTSKDARSRNVDHCIREVESCVGRKDGSSELENRKKVFLLVGGLGQKLTVLPATNSMIPEMN